MKKISSCRGVETTLSRGRIFTIFAIPLKNIVMSDSEKIKELQKQIQFYITQTQYQMSHFTNRPI